MTVCSRRIILEYEGALYQVEVEVTVVESAGLEIQFFLVVANFCYRVQDQVLGSKTNCVVEKLYVHFLRNAY